MADRNRNAILSCHREGLDVVPLLERPVEVRFQRRTICRSDQHGSRRVWKLVWEGERGTSVLANDGCGASEDRAVGVDVWWRVLEGINRERGACEGGKLGRLIGGHIVADAPAGTGTCAEETEARRLVPAG